jgi:aminopeptidase C
MLADDLAVFIKQHKDGVYQRSKSSSAAAGHAVVLIGYNNTGSYWIVKNSFGAFWGNGGFFKAGGNVLTECISQIRQYVVYMPMTALFAWGCQLHSCKGVHTRIIGMPCHCAMSESTAQ